LIATGKVKPKEASSRSIFRLVLYVHTTIYCSVLSSSSTRNNDSYANDNSSNECKSPNKMKGFNNIDNRNNHNKYYTISSDGNVIGNMKEKLSAVDTFDYPFELK